MPVVKLDASTIGYSAAISACGKSAQLRSTLKLLSQMPRVGLQPNAISYSAAISACEKAAQWELALGLLTLMHRVGPGPDTVSYAAAISTCGKAARWQLALGLLRAARHWPGARRRLLQHCHQRLREGCPVAVSFRTPDGHAHRRPAA
mmetsp:Transcript_3857/g.12072  ORF Transcript_3857/g.12072 Transcript_3857/m.12072 type:complete len:148 (-) Transcript_3857:169-612(-)